jgi:phospholipid transport system substrate-binding protein
MKRFFAILLGTLSATVALAQEPAPDVLVRTVANDVLDIVRKDKDIQSGNLAKAVAMAQDKVLPHFDAARMTRLAVGKDWKKATPEQQKTLVDEFQVLLIRTYSKALVEFRDQTVDVKPFKMQADEVDVLVRTTINQPGSKPVQIDYSLEKTEQGWKVYDLVVAGVSLVINYRSSFTQEVSANGIDGLIKSLHAKNAGGDAPAKK